MTKKVAIFLVYIFIVLVGCSKDNELMMEEENEPAFTFTNQIKHPDKTIEEVTAENILDEIIDSNKQIDDVRQKIDSNRSLIYDDHIIIDRLLVEQEVKLFDRHIKQHNTREYSMLLMINLMI